MHDASAIIIIIINQHGLMNRQPSQTSIWYKQTTKQCQGHSWVVIDNFTCDEYYRFVSLHLFTQPLTWPEAASDSEEPILGLDEYTSMSAVLTFFLSEARLPGSNKANCWRDWNLLEASQVHGWMFLLLLRQWGKPVIKEEIFNSEIEYSEWKPDCF